MIISIVLADSCDPRLPACKPESGATSAVWAVIAVLVVIIILAALVVFLLTRRRRRRSARSEPEE